VYVVGLGVDLPAGQPPEFDDPVDPDRVGDQIGPPRVAAPLLDEGDRLVLLAWDES
jgi:hypothetical protein